MQLFVSFKSANSLNLYIQCAAMSAEVVLDNAAIEKHSLSFSEALSSAFRQHFSNLPSGEFSDPAEVSINKVSVDFIIQQIRLFFTFPSTSNIQWKEHALQICSEFEAVEPTYCL